jgi:hypothetical protein
MIDNSDLATCAITWLGGPNQQANTGKCGEGAGEKAMIVYVYTIVFILGYEDTCRDLAE